MHTFKNHQTTTRRTVSSSDGNEIANCGNFTGKNGILQKPRPFLETDLIDRLVQSRAISVANSLESGKILKPSFLKTRRLTIIWYPEQGRMVPRGFKVEVMSKGGVMNSTMSKTNFFSGRFQLRLLQDGNLVLNTRDIFPAMLTMLIERRSGVYGWGGR
ncbi:hypothetical protein L1887_06915 [Cichorium endivia]|nr:hypothetical protein L1887_06915 [Cichorium endivia]